MPRKSNVAERWGVVIIFLIAIGGIAQAWSSERINEIVLEETGITCVDGDILEYNGTYWKCANNTAIITGNASGSGPYHPHDQALNTTNAVTFTTINTGQGANELYDMNQNVKTNNDVDFLGLEIGKGIYYGETGLGAPSFETFFDLYQTNKYTAYLSFTGSNDDVLPPFDDDTSDTHFIKFDTKNNEMTFQDGGGTHTLTELATGTAWGTWTENPATHNLNIGGKEINNTNKVTTNRIRFGTAPYHILRASTNTLIYDYDGAQPCFFNKTGLYCDNFGIPNDEVVLQSTTAKTLDVNISNEDVCTFNETGLNCTNFYGDGSKLTGIPETYVHVHNQNLNTTNNVAFKNISSHEYEIYKQGNDIYTKYDTNDYYIHTIIGDDDGPIDFMKIGGTDSNNKITIHPNATTGLDVGGLLAFNGIYSFSTIGVMMSAQGTYTGSNWFLFNAQPIANVTGKVGLFRLSPTYTSGKDHKVEIIELVAPAHVAGENDEYKVFHSNPGQNYFAFSADDNTTADWNYFKVGLIPSFGDAGFNLPNVTMTGYEATIGGSRFAGTGGQFNATGFKCTGFGSWTGDDTGITQRCFYSDGGENLYKNSVMNQTNGGYSLWNTPHAEAYNVTPNGYTLTIGSLNTWVNITGLLVGELEEFTFDNGLIPNHDGRYKLDWSLSFGGSGGSTHKTGVLVNNVEHEPCTSFRKLGTAGDVGNMGGTCILTAVGGDNITLAVQDILAPAQNIDVWSVNYNLEYVGET